MKIDYEFVKNRPLSYSSLKSFRKSPLHYIEYLTKPFKPSPQMVLGSLIDIMVLTPEKFDDTYIVVCDIDKRTKAGKEEYSRLLLDAQESNKTIVSEDMHETAKKCVQSLYSHKGAKEMLENKKRTQIKLQWKNTETNLPLIGYADFETLFNGEYTIGELKTSSDANPISFMRNALSFEYWLQAAMYLDFYHKVKYRFPQFIWMVVETSAPFAVSVIKFTEEDIKWAKEEFYKTMQAFKYCMDNEQFNKGYEFTLLDLPYSTEMLPKYKRNIYS